jgi:TonB family protein
MRVLYLTMVSLLTLSAQPFPDGAALLKQSADAFKSYNTYQYTQVTNTGMAGMEITMVQQGTSSGKMRMEMKMGSIAAALMVSDGQNMWMYMGMLNRYMKFPADAAATGSLASAFGGGQVPDMSQLSQDAKVVRSETIEVDGVTHDCWVIEARMTDFAPPIARGVSVKGGVTTHWIDKVSNIEFKTMMKSKMQMPGSSEPIDTSTTSTRHAVKINEPLPDSLFVFTPPADAKETDELFPGMKDMFPKAVKDPAPAKGVVNGAVKNPAPVPGEPQAFVRFLTPVEETEAVYPEAARAKNVRGMVELLVTIDPAGSVVKAEPLTGAEVLRNAAIDAVRQWKFRPVIRNGNPVFAYTTAMVDFVDHSKPFKPGDSPTDLNEEMAVLHRLELLEEKFPRSPQEEFADLEQDHRGTDGIDHGTALSQLAKSALRADAIDKATMYATQLLRLPPKDYDYGQAVHDGNMVLGVVSLRQGNVNQAKHYLVEAGKTSGSSLISQFGPNMLLAKGLLEKGERDAVIEYFQACKAFWKDGATQLDEWTAAVRGGGMPSFSVSLIY